MQTRYDQNAPKQATNLSINSDLLKMARSMNVNLSVTLEKALDAKLVESEAEQWQRDNSNAIKAYNDAISEHGCFAEEYRTF
ncbi:type II toxin-antitoxin system CcdA family antitoxin [Halomonas sp. OfavH-34-E]|uniref:type II toxin-antitoxin system CcdA family antitoxin n=1 Tax=Halomonas sp. OfavH-34-E TaxID=2954491 RepID=UPI0025B76901|nr:type II toxin-antitoxin system CcdA family antitoxin [Halomonas sp. OfavH-34-E]